MSVDSPPSSGATDLTAVVAMTPSGVIGDGGGIPWRLSTDLRRFKRLTMGGVLIMGRRTYESIGRPLPGRKIVVVTRNADWTVEGVEVASSPEAAITRLARRPGFVVGGAEIYRCLLPRCARVLLTQVWSNVAGDTVLDIDFSDFRIDELTRIPASVRDDVPSDFCRLSRRGKPVLPD
jgi:dihydrofolate reductase